GEGSVPMCAAALPVLTDACLLINIHPVPLQAFILRDAPHVALEVPVINRVEANKRAKEPPIRFDDSCSEKVSARGQARLQLIERSEQRPTSPLVRALSGCEARFVNAVVHPILNESRELGVLAFDVLREQIDLEIAEGVENVVEHPANVVLGIVDDLACLLVQKYRNSDAAIQASIRWDVSLAQTD